MPTITFIDADGTETVVQAREGNTLMATAVEEDVEGIVAECGGGMACATCHCYVDAAWIDRVGPPGDIENDMLEFTDSPRQPGSRLSCQVALTPALDGLIVRLPDSQ